jgi:hypothetical protein
MKTAVISEAVCLKYLTGLPHVTELVVESGGSNIKVEETGHIFSRISVSGLILNSF